MATKNATTRTIPTQPEPAESPYLRNPGSPPDKAEYKNALRLDNLLRSFGLSDVHIGYIMDAVKPFKLTPLGPLIEIKGVVIKRKPARRRARKSA
jgi:hypothetical protein